MQRLFPPKPSTKSKITTSPGKWSAIRIVPITEPMSVAAANVAAVVVALAISLFRLCARMRVNGMGQWIQKWSPRSWDWITIENNLFSYFVWTPAKGNFGRDSWKLGLYIEITWTLHRACNKNIISIQAKCIAKKRKNERKKHKVKSKRISLKRKCCKVTQKNIRDFRLNVLFWLFRSQDSTVCLVLCVCVFLFHMFNQTKSRKKNANFRWSFTAKYKHWPARNDQVWCSWFA